MEPNASYFERYDLPIEKIAKGDINYLSKVYEDLKRPVFLLILSILKDYSLSEDAMQDTFIKVNQNAKSYQKGTNAKAWILKIARNTALNYLKKQAFESPLDDDNPSGCDMEQEAITSLDFLKALEPFDETDRSIITLHIFGRLTHLQIAAIVGLKAGNVRMRYSRMIKKLKNYYYQK